MNEQTPPDPLEYLPDIVSRLKDEFLLASVGYLLLVLAIGIFAPDVVALFGRRFFILIVVLAFVAYLVVRVLRVWQRLKEMEHEARQAAIANSTPPAPADAPAYTTSETQPSVVLTSPCPPASTEALRPCYLESLIGDCRRARLIGLAPSASDPTRGGMTLESLYMALDTKTQVEVQQKEGKRERALRQERETRLLSALEALSQAPERRIVLLGQPGAGKSMFVRYLTLRMAQALADRSRNLAEDLPGWQHAPLLLLIVPLGRLAESISTGTERGSAELVERFIRATVDADDRLASYGDVLLDELRNDGGIVCFDGLDEVASLDLRPVVRESVEAFAERYAHNGATAFLVTCRMYSYNDARWQLSGWPVYELAPFGPPRIEAFVNAWHSELQRVDPAGAENYARKRAHLLEALRPGDRRRLYEIAPNPLILTVMAVVHTHEGE